MELSTPPVRPKPTDAITIVFVDDQPHLLESVREVTADWGDVWTSYFVESGPAALELLAELDHVDVIVTDLRMPGMDGAELLELVRDRHPHTARIVLAGQAERDEVLRTVGPAHQYLSKPVDISELVQVVEHARTAALNTMSDPIRALIGQADRLPSPPGMFQRLIDLLASRDWTVNDVADLLGDDVALTAEILKLVNSAFFGYFGEVNSVNRAVSLLGVDLIHSVVLGSKLFEADDEIENWLDLEQLDWRCKSVAHGARALAIRDRAPSDVAAQAYLTGMVCEIGMLVMARVPDVDHEAASVLNHSTDLDIEREIFGGQRFQVGCHLLRLWGFSETIVGAIDQLADPNVHESTGLSWYLFAARRLVLDAGMDPFDLAVTDGSTPHVDHELDLLRAWPQFVAAS